MKIQSAKPGPAELQTASLQIKRAEAAREVAVADLAAIHARLDADRASIKTPGPEAQARALLAAQAERWLALQNAGLALAQAELGHHQALRKSKEEAAKAVPKLDSAKKAYDVAFQSLKSVKSNTNYTPVSPTYPGQSTGRRAALAEWITSPANPLTARVAVNHIWRWHFGRALVASTADFGRNGTPPTHPALLDWLAQELMHPSTAGVPPWSMKAMHRLIVTSETYRSASQPLGDTKIASAADPGNTLYWHFPRQRMEAELVRDSMLQAAGVLDTTLGGPDIDLAQGLVSHRRSLYFTHHGESRMPFLEVFDAADACDAYRRSTSVVPQQALALVNNDFLVGLSQTLADKLWAEGQAGPPRPEIQSERFITASFESVLSRRPKPAELKMAREFLASQRSIIQAETPGGGAEALARRDLVHALFSHNDFLTIH